MAKGKNRKSRGVVIFEEEVIKKENAEKILHNLQAKLNSENAKGKQLNSAEEHVIALQDQFSNENSISKKTKKKKKNHTKPGQNENPQHEHQKKNKDNNEDHIEKQVNTVNNLQKRKLDINEEGEHIINLKKKNKPIEFTNEEGSVKDEIEDNSSTKPEGESKRAIKRKRHMKLIEKKKLQSDLKIQQNVLNYLSKWKYSRTDWKFEKLKQIWLQQNLYDCAKIPNEFWETTVEYFSGSKGFTREAALKEALKIIEEHEVGEEKSSDSVTIEDYQIKLQRARNIIQNLQE